MLKFDYPAATLIYKEKTGDDGAASDAVNLKHTTTDFILVQKTLLSEQGQSSMALPFERLNVTT